MKKIYILLCFFILALGIRYTAILPTSGVEADEGEYDRLAMNLMVGNGYIDSDGAGAPTSHRPPLYPMVLAGIYALFGHSYFIARCFNALLGAATVCIYYLITEKIFGRPSAILTALISSFYMTFILYTRFLYTETFFSFLIALITLMIVSVRIDSVIGLISIGLISGCASLIKSTGFFMPAISTIVLFVNNRKDKNIFNKIMVAYMVLIISFMAVIIPWTIRNYKAHGALVFISTNGGLNMYQAARPFEGKYFEVSPQDEVMKKAATIMNEVERGKFYVKSTIEFYKTQPLEALKILLMRFLFFWNMIDWNVTNGNVINYHYIFIVPFAIFGIFSAIKNRKDILAISLVILYFISLVLLFQGTPRFRMPIEGYIVMLGSYGIYIFTSRAVNRIRSVLLVLAYFIFTYVLYLNSSSVKYLIKNLVGYLGLW